VIAEINTPRELQTFAETLNTGHGVISTTFTPDVEALVNRVESTRAPRHLPQVDLVIFRGRSTA